MAGPGRVRRCFAERRGRVPAAARVAVVVLGLGLSIVTFGPALARLVGLAPDGWERVVRAGCRPFCHQLPGRTLAVAGHPLPLCARCTGMWLGITLGAALGVAWMPRRRYAVGLGVALASLGLSALEWLREGAQHLSWPAARLGLGLLLFLGLLVALAGDLLALVAGGGGRRGAGG